MEIIDSFESAYDAETRGSEGGAADFAAVLAAAVEPLVGMCERSAEALNGAPSSRWLPPERDPAWAGLYLDEEYFIPSMITSMCPRFVVQDMRGLSNGFWRNRRIYSTYLVLLCRISYDKKHEPLI